MTTREGDTVTTQETAEVGEDDLSQFEGVTRFVGYGQAAKYLGLQRNTLSSYCARGIGPAAAEHQVVDQYNMPVFTREELDTWRANRPGQGARTDLLTA